VRNSIVRAGEPFGGRLPELSVNFDEIISRSDGISKSYIRAWGLIINYCIVINTYYNYISNV